MAVLERASEPRNAKADSATSAATQAVAPKHDALTHSGVSTESFKGGFDRIGAIEEVRVLGTAGGDSFQRSPAAATSNTTNEIATVSDTVRTASLPTGKSTAITASPQYNHSEATARDLKNRSKLDPNLSETKAEEQKKEERSGITGFFTDLADDFGVTNVGRGLGGLYKAVTAAHVATFHAVKGAAQAVGSVVGLSSFEEAQKSFQKVGEETKKSVEGLKTSGQIAWGGIKLIGEFSGITDLGKAVYHGGHVVKCLITGDSAGALEHGMQAALHGGFALLSIGSIVATVATGGAAAGAVVGVAALRMGMKTAAQKTLEHSASLAIKGLGKEFGEKLITSVGRETMHAAAKELGREIPKEAFDRVSKELSEEARRQGIKNFVELGSKISTEQLFAITKNAFKEITEERVAKQLKEWGAVELVENAVRENCEKLGKMSRKELAQHLEERFIATKIAEGMQKELAEKEAKEFASKAANSLHKALAGKGAGLLSGEVTQHALKNGIVEQMTREATQALRKDLYEVMAKEAEPFIQEGAEKLGKEFGLSAAQKEAVQKAAKEGMEEGFEAGVRKVIREGVEQAFRNRNSRRHGVAAVGAAALVGLTADELGDLGELTSPVRDHLKKIEDGNQRNPALTAKRETIYVSDLEPRADGSMVRTLKAMSWVPERERYELASVEQFIVRGTTAKNAEEAATQRIVSKQEAARIVVDAYQEGRRQEQSPLAA